MPSRVPSPLSMVDSELTHNIQLTNNIIFPHYIFRVYVKNSIAYIGPLAVDQSFRGRGIGRQLLDFAESFAKTCEIKVVSCRADLFPMYERRGYKAVGKVPVTTYIPEYKLTRLNVDFVSMQKS